MCEHEKLAVCTIVLPGVDSIKRAFCTRCGKGKAEIHLEQQLAAANARIAELENKLTSHAPDGQQYNNAQFIEMRQCAEQTESQNNRMQTAINRYVIGNIDLLDALKAALEEKP